MEEMEEEMGDFLIKFLYKELCTLLCIKPVSISHSYVLKRQGVCSGYSLARPSVRVKHRP